MVSIKVTMKIHEMEQLHDDVFSHTVSQFVAADEGRTKSCTRHGRLHPHYTDLI
jgi:hypothetical protein